MISVYQINRNLFILALLLSLSFTSFLNAQVAANKEVGKKHQAYADSLKNSDYPYALPIWGDKVTKMGISLPYSAGLSVQYITQESDLIMDKLMVGFNGGEMYSLDEVIKFNETRNSTTGVNFRPDVWVLPFLNVYALFAGLNTSTYVDASLYLPDSTGGTSEALRFNTQVDFKANTFGFGFTPTFAVAGAFVALDMNFTWTDIPELKKPAFGFIFGPRVGKTFKFKKPERNIAFWVGGFRLKLSALTEGSIALDEVVNTDEFQAKVDQGLVRVDEAYLEVETWWDNLTPTEQQNPINKAKYEKANDMITTTSNFLVSADSKLNDDESNTVQYSLEKRPADMWNFLIGTQFQVNKHWMVRAEYGFLSSRTQLMVGLQYRFGL